MLKIVKAYGFNINFAPVLDINSNPNNPVIGDRSFGNDDEIVSKRLEVISSWLPTAMIILSKSILH